MKYRDIDKDTIKAEFLKYILHCKKNKWMKFIYIEITEDKILALIEFCLY